MVHRTVSARTGIAAVFLYSTLAFAPASLVAQAGAKQSSGVEFDMKTTMSVSGGMSGMLAGVPPGYSGHGVVAGNRMRIDILDGALALLAEKGDYILFDTAGMTIVHPSKKEFVPIPKDFSTKALDQMLAMGMSVSIGGIGVTFDSLPGTDTIAGFPTRHYRTSVGYTLTLEGMGTAQQMKSEATSEYWMATIPGLASSPLERASQLSGSGQGLNSTSTAAPFKELVAKTDSVTRRMTGTAVRMRATTTSESGLAGTMGIDMTSEMSNLKRSPVADGMFVVPSDYTRGASPLGGN